MNNIFKEFIEKSVKNNTNEQTLKKGKYPCECDSKNKDGTTCNGDAYWRWSDEEYCDRHLPLEGRLLFCIK